MNLGLPGLGCQPMQNHILQQRVTAPRENYTLLCSPLSFFWGLPRWLASDIWGRLAIRQGFSPRSDCLKWHPGSGRSCIQESWPSLRHQSSWDSQCTLALLENHWAAPLAERKKNIKTTTNKAKGGKISNSAWKDRVWGGNIPK